jgi:hypothetical protein
MFFSFILLFLISKLLSSFGVLLSSIFYLFFLFPFSFPFPMDMMLIETETESSLIRLLTNDELKRIWKVPYKSLNAVGKASL